MKKQLALIIALLATWAQSQIVPVSHGTQSLVIQNPELEKYFGPITNSMVWPTNTFFTTNTFCITNVVVVKTKIKVEGKIQEIELTENQLEDLVNNLAKNGFICRFKGHCFVDGRPGEGDGWRFADYHPTTNYRHCTICGLTQSQDTTWR